MNAIQVHVPGGPRLTSQEALWMFDLLWEHGQNQDSSQPALPVYWERTKEN